MALAASTFRLNSTRPAFKHASCAFTSSASWMALSASLSDLGQNRGVGFGGMVVVEKRKDIPFSSHRLPFYPPAPLVTTLEDTAEISHSLSLAPRVCPPCFTFDCLHCHISSWIS